MSGCDLTESPFRFHAHARCQLCAKRNGWKPSLVFKAGVKNSVNNPKNHISSAPNLTCTDTHGIEKNDLNAMPKK